MGLLLIDCWICISCAISFGFVRMLSNLSIRQSSEGLSLFLKTLRLIFLGFLSYNCWYLDMVFLICVLV